MGDVVSKNHALSPDPDVQPAPRSASEPGHTNECVMRVVGMSRSGNHAIIGWILAQHPARWVFLNCAEPETNPFESARSLDDGDSFRTNIAGFDLRRERRGALSRKDLLLYSHEDTFLKKALAAARSCSDPGFIGTAGAKIDVLILRDPFNLFASRQRLDVSLIPAHIAIRMWKQHARAFLGRSPYLSPHRRLVAISYNRWRASPAYRREVAAALGVPFSDAGFEQVMPVAGGSSFDGAQLAGRASAMATTERWRRFAACDEFQRLFDEQVLDLSERIFGPLPAADWVRARLRAGA